MKIPGCNLIVALWSLRWFGPEYVSARLVRGSLASQSSRAVKTPQRTRGEAHGPWIYYSVVAATKPNQDTRDSVEYWEGSGVGALEALEKTLRQGTVVNTAWRETGNRRPSRVAPPIANNRRAINSQSFDWYAVFEFRDGKWYMTAFNECCE